VDRVKNSMSVYSCLYTRRYISMFVWSVCIKLALLSVCLECVYKVGTLSLLALLGFNQLQIENTWKNVSILNMRRLFLSSFLK
jgi:hypothetical protein